MAVYFYFAVALVARQWIQKDNDNFDLHIPIFLIFEFLFYFGWLNVASTLYNPFGDDDDDFELMDLLNRHINVCMKIVDVDKDDIPEIQDDVFWRPPSSSSSEWRPTLVQRKLEVKVEKE